jgi:hypothetical protein
METDMNEPINHGPLSTGKMPPDDLYAPWSLHFDRDGTEDFAVICDADGDDLLISRTFWLPEDGDPVPPTLAFARLAAAAPKLLAACRMVVARWEKGDLAEAARACQAAVALAEGPGEPPLPPETDEAAEA